MICDDQYDARIHWEYTPPAGWPIHIRLKPHEQIERDSQLARIGRELQAAVLAYLQERGPATASGTAKALLGMGYRRWNYHTIRKALPAMCNGGLLVAAGYASHHPLYRVA